jgi:hypothetical protein
MLQGGAARAGTLGLRQVNQSARGMSKGAVLTIIFCTYIGTLLQTTPPLIGYLRSSYSVNWLMTTAKQTV